MKNEINLLHTKTKSPLSSLANKVDLLRTIAIFLLFLVAILSVSFFFLVLVSPLPALRIKENAKRLELRSLYSKISDLYVINDRVKGVSDIFDKRVNFDDILTLLLNKLPSGLSVDAIRSSDSEVTVDVSSLSLLTLQEYMADLVKNNQSTKNFSSITQSSLSISPNNDKVSVHLILSF
jgi:hypothetical protein